MRLTVGSEYPLAGKFNRSANPQTEFPIRFGPRATRPRLPAPGRGEGPFGRISTETGRDRIRLDIGHGLAQLGVVAHEAVKILRRPETARSAQKAIGKMGGERFPTVQDAIKPM